MEMCVTGTFSTDRIFDLTNTVRFDQHSMTDSTKSGRSVGSPNAAVKGREWPRPLIESGILP